MSEMDSMSIRSDTTAWNDLTVLKAQAQLKQRQAQQALKQCIALQIELESEQAQVKILEQQLQEARQKVRTSRAESSAHQRQSREFQAKFLQEEYSSLQSENSSLKGHIQRLMKEHASFKLQTNSALAQLQNDITALTRNPQTRQSSLELHMSEAQQELQALKQELRKLNSEIEYVQSEIQKKDNRISELDRVIIDLQDENENLAENISYMPQPAQPPPESYNPIVDIYPQASQQGLVSDVGSTGAWRPIEETKERQNASPDPFENLLHQSTGETSQHFREEPPTPPRDAESEFSQEENITHQDFHHQDSEHEEEKTPPGRSMESSEEFYQSGTPRREDALSSRPSRTSTPPRVTYERTSSPNAQVINQRVHNLTQLNNPTHYSVPRQNEVFDSNEFFVEMQRETDDRRRRNVNTLPRNFFE